MRVFVHEQHVHGTKTNPASLPFLHLYTMSADPARTYANMLALLRGSTSSGDAGFSVAGLRAGATGATGGDAASALASAPASASAPAFAKNVGSGSGWVKSISSNWSKLALLLIGLIIVGAIVTFGIWGIMTTRTRTPPPRTPLQSMQSEVMQLQMQAQAAAQAQAQAPTQAQIQDPGKRAARRVHFSLPGSTQADANTPTLIEDTSYDAGSFADIRNEQLYAPTAPIPVQARQPVYALRTANAQAQAQAHAQAQAQAKPTLMQRLSAHMAPADVERYIQQHLAHYKAQGVGEEEASQYITARLEQMLQELESSDPTQTHTQAQEQAQEQAHMQQMQMQAHMQAQHRQRHGHGHGQGQGQGSGSGQEPRQRFHASASAPAAPALDAPFNGTIRIDSAPTSDNDGTSDALQRDAFDARAGGPGLGSGAAFEETEADAYSAADRERVPSRGSGRSGTGKVSDTDIADFEQRRAALNASMDRTGRGRASGMM